MTIETDTAFKANRFNPRHLVMYLGIAFGWTWLFNALFISGILQMPGGIGTSSTNVAAILPIIGILLVMPFGPTIGGFVVTGMTDGRRGINNLWKRFWSRRITLSWLAVILLYYPLFFLLLRASGMFILGRGQPDPIWLGQPWILLAPFLASCLHGGLSEEFGWRGYALPLLQARFNATTSSCILGVTEGLWHLPLAFIPSLAGWEGRAIALFLIWWIPVSITRTWVFNNTKGSVLAAVLFHAMGNTASDVVPINVISLLPGGMGYFYLLLFSVPISVAIVLVFGYRELVRSENNHSQNVNEIAAVSVPILSDCFTFYPCTW